MSDVPAFAQISPTVTESPFPVIGSVTGNLRAFVEYTGDGTGSKVITTGSPRSSVVISDKTDGITEFFTIDDSNSKYSAASTNSLYQDETGVAFASGFPSLTTMDVGALNTGNCNTNILNKAYRVWVFG